MKYRATPVRFRQAGTTEGVEQRFGRGSFVFAARGLERQRIDSGFVEIV
jgi:hypothetical protein